MPAAAIVGAAVVGGVISSNAAKSAAKTQAKGAERDAELRDQQYQQTRNDQLAQLAQQRADSAPYREAGYGALSQLVGGTQPGGEFNRAFTMQDYQQDPGYQFRLAEGEQGINRAATASGSRYSGATLKALSRFNSNQASQEYGNAYNRFNNDQTTRYNRLAGLSGTGQASVNQVGQAGQNAYGQIAVAGQANAAGQGQAAQNAAAATASGYVGQANAVNGVIGGLANAYQQNQYLNSLSGSGAAARTGYYDMPAFGTGIA